MFRQITEYIAKKSKGIYRVAKTRIDNYEGNLQIYMEVILLYGYNVVEVLNEFKTKCIKEIGQSTTMNVKNIEVIAKGIYIPEETQKNGGGK